MGSRSDSANAHPLVEAGRIMVVPGVYDALSAKLAARAGFPALVLTGYGLAASQLGEPDFGLLTQTEVLDAARRVIAAVDVGVIVDGDTGYGGPLNVQRLVRELVAMGARGVILEDQRWPKRCGHMRGKEVIPRAPTRSRRTVSTRRSAGRSSTSRRAPHCSSSRDRATPTSCGASEPSCPRRWPST
jgi:methylisocitrate lyase